MAKAKYDNGTFWGTVHRDGRDAALAYVRDLPKMQRWIRGELFEVSPEGVPPRPPNWFLLRSSVTGIKRHPCAALEYVTRAHESSFVVEVFPVVHEPYGLLSSQVFRDGTQAGGHKRSHEEASDDGHDEPMTKRPRAERSIAQPSLKAPENYYTKRPKKEKKRWPLPEDPNHPIRIEVDIWADLAKLVEATHNLVFPEYKFRPVKRKLRDDGERPNKRPKGEKMQAPIAAEDEKQTIISSDVGLGDAPNRNPPEPPAQYRPPSPQYPSTPLPVPMEVNMGPYGYPGWSYAIDGIPQSMMPSFENISGQVPFIAEAPAQSVLYTGHPSQWEPYYRVQDYLQHSNPYTWPDAIVPLLKQVADVLFPYDAMGSSEHAPWQHAIDMGSPSFGVIQPSASRGITEHQNSGGTPRVPSLGYPDPLSLAYPPDESG